ncbi:MAG: tetratricopeptide repeat protein [Thermoguttaceae bacterium]
MGTIPETLAIAFQHHQAGRLQAAEQIYRQILQAEPNHADAIHLLGLIAHQVGKYQIAVEYIGRAIQLHGSAAAFHNNLGNALKCQRKLDEAVACYRRALELKPAYAEAYNNLGAALNDQGKPDEAVACYRRALQFKPDYADARYNLGNALKDQRKPDEALACYRQALELKPDYVQAHNNMGNVFKGQGKLDEAVACYRRALELKPDHTGTHINLGIALKDQGKPDEAVACYRRALELKPDLTEAHINLGIVFKDQGKLDEAVAAYRRALELQPDYADADNNLGNVFRDQGKLDEAVASYRRALERKPDYADAHYNLGAAFVDQGKLDEAVACYRRALKLKPDYAEAHDNLGNAFKDQGKLAEAVACYRRALELNPGFAEAHNNLGVAFADQGNLDDAVRSYRRALDLKPGFVQAHNNLGVALMGQGRADEAVACYRRALDLRPDNISIHSNLLYSLQYCAGVTPGGLAEAHAEYDRRHAVPLHGAVAQHENVRQRHGRLRLGFVSPDLGRHPVGYFLVRVLENLSQGLHETVCYSDRITKDGLTHRLQAAASQWCDVVGMSDQRLAEQIRADRIDILFDLAGHTAHNRLLVFARKPAPIQITWIGYEGTTGLAAMDYLLADRHVVPEGTEHYYREKVLQMPGGYLCYDPPDAAPPAGPLPSLKNGYTTFGSFNNLAKITPNVVAVWAEILRRAPTARLILKYRGLADQTVRRRYLDLFAAHDVGPQRLELLPSSSYAEYLATYHQVDVALDPFPFSGSVTTCEALWMGVPVVTCPFETFASRHSLSHLSNLGLTETIAHDLHEYVEIAVSLAGDLPRLAGLRAGLRERMAASPLCDGKRFATHLASMLYDVWEQGIG